MFGHALPFALSRLLGAAAVSTALVVGPTAVAPAHAGPIQQAADFVATNLHDAGARIALAAGTFVTDVATGLVTVVDQAGAALEILAPKVVVDGVVRVLDLSISNGGTTLVAFVEGGINAGATVAADAVHEAGASAESCVRQGFDGAVSAGLIAAITGGLAALATGPVGVVTAAATAGTAGAVSGFSAGCATGLGTAVLTPTAPAGTAISTGTKPLTEVTAS